MDYLLRSFLPIEIVEKIMKDIHNRYMRELICELTQNVVWIRTATGEYSFLVGKTSNNPYYVLRDYIPANFKSVKCYNNRLHYNFRRENSGVKN